MTWIINDYRAHPTRFIVETVAWAISIGCALTMAIFIHNPPLHYLYPMWITGCVLYAWSAYSRRSFGMLANYVLLVCIDVVGFTYLLLG